MTVYTVSYTNKLTRGFFVVVADTKDEALAIVQNWSVPYPSDTEWVTEQLEFRRGIRGGLECLRD